MTSNTSIAKRTSGTLATLSDRWASALHEQQLPATRFLQTAQMACVTGDLAIKLNEGKVDTSTLYAAVGQCASDGLMLDGREAAMATFWNKKKAQFDVQYMPMVAGLIKRVCRDGAVARINAWVVHKNDVFRYWVDNMGEHVEHSPDMFGDRGAPIGVFAQAVLKDGEVKVDVMTRAQIDRVAETSKSPDQYDPDRGPFFDQWWCKAVVRRVTKRIPLQTDISSVLQADNDTFVGGDFIDGEVVDDSPPAKAEPKKPKKSRAKATVMGDAKSGDIEDATVTETSDPAAGSGAQSDAGDTSSAPEDMPPI